MKWFRRFFVPIILVFLVVISYANSLNSGFVSDDISGIVKTAHTWTFPAVAVTKTVIHGQMLGLYVVYKLFGLAPWAYRLVNILCHAVSVLLVYAIVSRLTRRKIGFFAAALFAVHPIIIESVAWISGGIYCQYGMLFLLSFWLYLKGRGQKTERREQTLYYLLSYVVYCFCLLFSEKASVLFLFFILYEFCFGNLKQNWRKLIPYFILSIILILFYLSQLHGRIATVSQMIFGEVGGMYNPFIQLPIALSSYFQLIIWPNNLTFYHSSNLAIGLDYVLRAIVFGFYIVGIVITAIKNRKLCFWLVWFW